MRSLFASTVVFSALRTAVLVGLLGGKLAPGVLAQRAAKQGLVLAPVELISSGSLGR